MGQTREQKILKQLSGSVQKQTPIATEMFIPNHSGDNSAGTILKTPTNDNDIPNKKYVDDEIDAKLDDGTTVGQMSYWNGSKWTYIPTTDVFYDSVNGRVGIGTDRPTEKFEIDGNLFLNGDNDCVYLGTGKDMSIYYDGTYGHINTSLKGASDLILSCGDDKTLELEESVWKDINMGAARLSKQESTPAPSIVNFTDENGDDTLIETYGFGIEEAVSGAFEIQHDYREASNFTFHVHFQIVDEPNPDEYVNWELIWTKGRDGETLPATATISKQVEVDTQYQMYRADFEEIDGGDFEIGDQFLFRLRRIDADGEDNYSGLALLETCGIHYEIDTIGSRQIITK